MGCVVIFYRYDNHKLSKILHSVPLGKKTSLCISLTQDKKAMHAAQIQSWKRLWNC